MDYLNYGLRALVVMLMLGAPFFYYSMSSKMGKWNTIQLRGVKSDFSKRTDACTPANPCRIKIIADSDQKSKIEQDDGKLKFKSYLLSGDLYMNDDGKYEISWDKSGSKQLFGKHNEAGRGMELSELVLFNNRLLTFDDRTGIVYEVTKSLQVIPRHVLTEGNGDTAKGMKVEWATVKDDKLYVGSFGKEYTSEDGKSIVSRNNFWIAVVDAYGDVEYLDWEPNYEKLRQAVGVRFPGYMIHEAVTWSPITQRWIILPRRVSKESYNEETDEMKGSNHIIIADAKMNVIQVSQIGKITPERGFSSFKFVPGTNDQVIVALKSAENSQLGTQASYITVFDLSGNVLLDEQYIPEPYKFEGIEFLVE